MGEHYDCIEVPREEQVARLIAEREEARAEVERRREQMDAERAGFDAFADLQRVKLESARAEVARLRRLALVLMAPGEVPTEPGWYVAQIRRSSRPESVELEHAAAPIGAPSVVWAAGEAMPFEAGDVHRWLARIPVEALGEVADG